MDTNLTSQLTYLNVVIGQSQFTSSLAQSAAKYFVPTKTSRHFSKINYALVENSYKSNHQSQFWAL